MRRFWWICIFYAGFCGAIEVSPMVLTLEPKQTSKPIHTTILNTLNRDIAFDIEVFEIDFSGAEPVLIALDQPPIWAFPPTLYLKKQARQRLQLYWQGGIPKTDKVYQVSLVEQRIPDSNAEPGSELTMLFNVNLIVHAVQMAFTPKLTVKSAHCIDFYCHFYVVNAGNGAARLSDYTIDVYDAKQHLIRIKKQQLKAGGYDVFFAPLSSRYVSIPILAEHIRFPSILLSK